MVSRWFENVGLQVAPASQVSSMIATLKQHHIQSKNLGVGTPSLLVPYPTGKSP